VLFLSGSVYIFYVQLYIYVKSLVYHIMVLKSWRTILYKHPKLFQVFTLVCKFGLGFLQKDFLWRSPVFSALGWSLCTNRARSFQ